MLNLIDSLSICILSYIYYRPISIILKEEIQIFAILVDFRLIWPQRDRLPIPNFLYNIAIALLLDILDRETKELPPSSFFIIIRR